MSRCPLDIKIVVSLIGARRSRAGRCAGDVDFVGNFVAGGTHIHAGAKIRVLREYDAFDDRLILVGGIVPDDDQEELRGQGVDEIFGPGASMDEMIDYIHENAPER